MSGGYFDYKQYHISMIADEIEQELNKQGKEIPKNQRYLSADFYTDYPEEQYYPIYPEKVQEKMREAVKYLRIAAIYAQRIDWFLSADDGEESFITRLEKDLKDLQA